MSESKTIECKPSQWFKIRAFGVAAMLTFFALWFFKDGYWGYRDKNEAVVMKQLFLASGESPYTNVDFATPATTAFKEQEYTADSWAAFASEQLVPVPESKNLLPRDFDYDQKWPEEIVNGYEELKNKKVNLLWVDFSGRTKLPREPSEKLYEEKTIREQFIVCGICAALLIIALFISIRIMGRKMMVTATGYTPPGGDEIPFTAMRKIDKRKWNNKGIAVIHYEDAGETKKAKIDGMIYGQFKEEDGAPAEALFSNIVENFKGEIIEIIEDDEDDEPAEENEK